MIFFIYSLALVLDLLGYGIGLDLGGSSSDLIIEGMELVRSLDDLVLVLGSEDLVLVWVLEIFVWSGLRGSGVEVRGSGSGLIMQTLL